jgi:hypothetical protein
VFDNIKERGFIYDDFLHAQVREITPFAVPDEIEGKDARFKTPGAYVKQKTWTPVYDVDARKHGKLCEYDKRKNLVVVLGITFSGEEKKFVWLGTMAAYEEIWIPD